MSSSPHPSAVILGARLRLRVSIRIPVFMPGAVNYTSRWSPRSRDLLNAHAELQFPENLTKIVSKASPPEVQFALPAAAVGRGCAPFLAAGGSCAPGARAG